MDLKCSYCDEVTSCDCPEDHNRYPEAKFMCEVCQTLCKLGEKEEDLKNSTKREVTKKVLSTSKQAFEYAEAMLEENFEEMWRDEKEKLKVLSKKELAEELYFRGLHIAASDFLTSIDPAKKDILREKAVAEYAKGKISTGRAAEIAGISWEEMNSELARRKIPLHYTEKELKEDLNVKI